MGNRLFILSLLFLLTCSLYGGNGKYLPDEDKGEVAEDDSTSEFLTVEEEAHMLIKDEADEALSTDGNKDDIVSNSLVSERTRVKRTTFNTSSFMWYQRIPYLIKFEDPSRRMRLRKLLDYIEDQLCVQFFDVGDRIDESDPDWPTKNGFETNAYIYFYTGKGCVSRFGKGSGKSARKVSPCYSFFSMRHETMHALGAHHEQKIPGGQKYLTLHRDNIQESKWSQYQPARPYRTNSAFFDPKSGILYSRTHFAKWGRGERPPTYDFVRPEMGQLSGAGMARTLFYELNQNYKCKEKYCSKVSEDCGPGYMTFTHDKCVCVCPDQYDPETNCRTLIEKVEGPKSWPDMPFTVFKAGRECPKGFQEGNIPIHFKDTIQQTGPVLPHKDNILSLEVCTKTTPTRNINWNDWPLGATCVGKLVGVDCELPFKERVYLIQTKNNKEPTGIVGDVSLDEKTLTMKFCCYAGGPYQLPIKLPTKTPFMLTRPDSGCQEVDGMFSTETRIETKIDVSVRGDTPNGFKRNRGYIPPMCTYVPPTYGCNRIFKVTSESKSVSFSIPKKGAVREGKRRCFYAFKAPSKSRLRLTLNKFNIHPSDKFYVKRFHPWTNPYRVLANSRQKQFITQENYLFVEFWSYHEESDKYTGADITVDLLLDNEMCYDAEHQGFDYAGEKSTSELYEECIPWKEATSCPDFPWKYSLTLLNNGNKCRNMDTVGMLQPWCYVKVKGKECVRRYCDVCNEAAPIDLDEDCAAKTLKNPELCADSSLRNKCALSCNVNQKRYDPSTIKCSKPRSNYPYHFKVAFQQKRLRKSYPVGSKLSVSDHKTESHDIVCTTHGWTAHDIDYAKKNCIDASQECKRTLENFPDFCTNENTKSIATEYCVNSCSLCPEGHAKPTPTQPTGKHTVPVAR